jgi:hypothetical protein
MLCPLWSIANKEKSKCIEDECGMVALCRPELIADLRPYDECPNGHKEAVDVSGSDTPEGYLEMLCTAEDCDERWLVPEGDS